jgi:hypothetical protein
VLAFAQKSRAPAQLTPHLCSPVATMLPTLPSTGSISFLRTRTVGRPPLIVAPRHSVAPAAVKPLVGLGHCLRLCFYMDSASRSACTCVTAVLGWQLIAQEPMHTGCFCGHPLHCLSPKANPSY